ncbi:MAG: hypothetical protein Q6370_000210 [Candidatus Sigynarchaeota archaeon]
MDAKKWHGCGVKGKKREDAGVDHAGLHMVPGDPTRRVGVATLAVLPVGSFFSHARRS